MLRNDVEDRLIERIDRLHGNVEPAPIEGLFAHLFPRAPSGTRRFVRLEAGAKRLDPA